MKILALPGSGDPSTTRFLFSAGRILAQLLLIVTGVFIALWADSWVASRTDRNAEAARLESLQQNIEQSLAALRAYRGELEATAAALAELLNENDAAPSGLAGRIETRILVGIFGVPAYWPELNVYEDLKNSGELGLLKDREVRRTLSAMDAGLQKWRLANDDLTVVQQLNVDPYLLRHLELDRLLSNQLGVNVAAGSFSAEDYERLLADRVFRNLVAFKLDIVQHVSRSSVQLESDFEQARLAAANRIAELGRRPDPIN
jgi:hypothetical protein